MSKSDINGRDEISYLVKCFYSKVQAHKQLGPIFNKLLVSEEVWEQHYDILTDFWEAVLFRGKNYKGHAVAMHLFVDSQMNYGIGEGHFQSWLTLWHDTIGENFEGPHTERAKSSAMGLAQTFYSKIKEFQKERNPSISYNKSLNFTYEKSTIE